MGYTHYWYVDRAADHEKVAEAGRLMVQVVREARVPLASWDGSGESLVDEKRGAVRFNGVGDDSHETFSWPPDLDAERKEWRPGSDWRQVFTFCKTAQKPYDHVVVACLLAAQRTLGHAIRIQSDASSWEEFIGAEMSDGWQQVNAMLGHPQEIAAGRETAVELYRRALGEEPIVPRAFRARAEA